MNSENYEIMVYGGGMFSLYHNCLEKLLRLINENVITIDNLNKYKITIEGGHVFTNKNIFNDIFVYDENLNFKIYDNDETHRLFNNSNVDENLLLLLKQIVNKNLLKPYIIDKVNYYKELFNITENTLGVHIRLTDMDSIHPGHGILTIDSYINAIDKLLKTNNNINSIFIACDNNISIHKIKNYYANSDISINYIVDSPRNPEEYCDNSNNIIETFNNDLSEDRNNHVKIMIEMLVLSKCSYFIHRTSDFANFAIIYSDTFKIIESL